MGLIRLGDYIEQTDIRNSTLSFTCENLKGLSINKNLIPTKANTNELDLKNYKIVRHNEFTYCTVTSRNGNKISLAYNDSDDCIVSSINPTFRVKDESKLLPRFLMMFFNRNEFDRYARFNSWGSARETFTWEDMCDIELDLPPIEIQRKYVAIYEGLLANLHSYESKLDELKLVCDGYIEDLRKKYPLQELRNYIDENKAKNETLDAHILGISNEGFIEPKQDVGNERNYTLFSYNDFVYSPPRINVGSIGLYKENEKCACSPIYVTFHVNDLTKLNPDYLAMWYKRSEFLRHTEFYSIASVRNNFSFDLMQEYKIPIPPIEIQNSIVEVFNVYNERKEFVNRLKNIIKDICPLLVRGAIKEASEVK